jgi:hypothetical protein
MKADIDSAAAELLREIKEENPGASEEELCKLFLAAAKYDEDAKRAIFSFFLKNAIRH